MPTNKCVDVAEPAQAESVASLNAVSSSEKLAGAVEGVSEEEATAG